jgi:hypothetical protein
MLFTNKNPPIIYIGTRPGVYTFNLDGSYTFTDKRTGKNITGTGGPISFADQLRVTQNFTTSNTTVETITPMAASRITKIEPLSSPIMDYRTCYQIQLQLASNVAGSHAAVSLAAMAAGLAAAAVLLAL